mgnify:FL=1
MDSNKLMSGELFEVDQNILKVVSLDGHRISIRKIELKESYELEKLSFQERHFRKSVKSFLVRQKVKLLFILQIIISCLSSATPLLCQD